jgi:predicted O-methyltransferase YrrM
VAGPTPALYDWAVANRDMVPHLETLSRYASECRSIVELGVRGGVSTWAFLDGLPIDGRLYSVDINDCVVPGRVANDPRWTFIKSDDQADELWRILPDTADMVFIDTSHEYKHTQFELLHALLCKPFRIVCHDAHWPGVEQAVTEFCLIEDWAIVALDEASDSDGDFSLVTLERS